MASSEHAQQADSNVGSLFSISAGLSAPSGRVDEAPEPNTTNDNQFGRSRAEALDAEAAYYGRRAIQEEQALGPGYYVNLLRSMATDRAAMAQRIRTTGI